MVEIVVHDFGSGIPPGQAEAVFEPFRRLGPPPNRGTGLGLYIARRLTEAMNGRHLGVVGTRPHLLLDGSASAEVDLESQTPSALVTRFTSAALPSTIDNPRAVPHER